MTNEIVSRAFRRERCDSRLIDPTDPTSVTDLPPADRPTSDIAPVRQMGELGQHELLNFHSRAHMPGFRGPLPNKSQRYGVTFRASTTSEPLDRVTDARPRSVDHDIVVVINDWVPVRFGHRDDAERDLAARQRSRIRQHRRTTTARRAA